MANEILTIPEELRARARQIRVLKGNHASTMKKLSNLVYSLSAEWKGDAQTAFVQKYTSMQPIFDNFMKTVDEFAVLMDEHANRMEKTDREIVGKINKI